jgi:hypothetical protein
LHIAGGFVGFAFSLWFLIAEDFPGGSFTAPLKPA